MFYSTNPTTSNKQGPTNQAYQLCRHLKSHRILAETKMQIVKNVDRPTMKKNRAYTSESGNTTEVTGSDDSKSVSRREGNGGSSNTNNKNANLRRNNDSSDNCSSHSGYSSSGYSSNGSVDLQQLYSTTNTFCALYHELISSEDSYTLQDDQDQDDDTDDTPIEVSFSGTAAMGKVRPPELLYPCGPNTKDYHYTKRSTNSDSGSACLTQQHTLRNERVNVDASALVMQKAFRLGSYIVPSLVDVKIDTSSYPHNRRLKHRLREMDKITMTDSAIAEISSIIINSNHEKNKQNTTSSSSSSHQNLSTMEDNESQSSERFLKRQKSIAVDDKVYTDDVCISLDDLCYR